MAGVRNKVLRPLALAWTFLRIGVMNELQYRVNFFVQLLQSLVAVATALVVLALVFSQTEELRGWSRAELLVVMAVHIMMGGVIRTLIQPNMERLIDDVRHGKLDFALTKPQDAQLLVSVREIRIWQAVDVLVGAVVGGIAVAGLEGGVGVTQVAFFLVSVLIGVVMIYCFWFILTTGAFWIVRMEFIVELFEGVYQAGRWPVGIYPGWLRTGLTFLVPLAFAITVPAQAVTDRLTTGTLLAAVGFCLLLVAITRALWRVGLRRYSGASA